MAAYIIFALVIVFLMAGSFFWMWKLSRYLVIPIQVALFILLIIVVVKVFATRENADKLKNEIDRSSLPKLETTILSVSSDAIRDSIKSNGDARPASIAPTSEDKVPAARAVPSPGSTSAATKKAEPAKSAGASDNFVDFL